MKRLLLIAASLAVAACASTHHNDQNPYANPFYGRYLNTGSPLDAQIKSTMNDLQANPRSARLHNTLGQLLLQKGFPKDAENELERAVNEDKHFYPAWYNLGLVRMSRGEALGAHFAFSRTVHYKPGHSAALFQLGLIEEKNNHQRAAIDYYAKAFAINHSLLDVRVNPRILDSKLVDIALLKVYPKDHARESMAFQQTPPDYVQEGLDVPPQLVTPPQNAPIVQPPAPTPQSVMEHAPPKPQQALQPAVQPAKPPL